MNIIYIFEQVLNLVKEKGLCESYFTEAAEQLENIGKLTNTNPVQTTIFAIILEKFGNYYVSLDEISDVLKCSRIQFLQYMEDIEELERKKLIRETTTYKDHRKDSVVNFTIPLDVVNAIRKGIVYRGKTNENLKPMDFFDYADDLFTEAKDDDMDFNTLSDEITDLLHNNDNLLFFKKLKEYCLLDISSIVMLYMCSALASRNDEKVDTDDILGILGNHLYRGFIRSFRNQENELVKKKLLNFEFCKGLFDTEYFILSQKAKDEFLADVTLVPKENSKNKQLLPLEKLSVKELYYNEKTKSRIEELGALLHEENLKTIQERLSSNGMRTGFACIFSGPPGTGKTETVYQIAKKTGRDIMLVDISETKSCWFGESEKLIKDVFAQYKKLVDNSSIAPILLFNEADAILGKRREISQSSGGVDQTENAIQNIILQEMEDLKGVLIATTNMTTNLDKAFERRFLYKIEFDKPDTQSKKLIWLSNINSLSEEDAAKLAEQFDLSGGQIENIARKSIISFILKGSTPTLSDLENFCKDESITKTERRIGF